MKEIELPVKSSDRLSIAEITTFENGIILVYKDSNVIGYIIFEDYTFEDYENPTWSYCDTINTSTALTSSDVLYDLINTLIKDYHITNIKLLEFNK